MSTMEHRIIFEQNNYRIIEIVDEHFDWDNLKGDTYNCKVNSDISEQQLKEEEKQFEDLVNREGVFGYILQKWNTAIDTGWEHVDSCYGFVGQYSESEEIFKHYIVDEMKNTIIFNIKLTK